MANAKKQWKKVTLKKFLSVCKQKHTSIETGDSGGSMLWLMSVKVIFFVSMLSQ